MVGAQGLELSCQFYSSAYLLLSRATAAASMIHFLVDDSLGLVRFELGQLGHLLHVINKGIRSALADLQVEINQARENPGTYSHPLAC